MQAAQKVGEARKEKRTNRIKRVEGVQMGQEVMKVIGYGKINWTWSNGQIE